MGLQVEPVQQELIEHEIPEDALSADVAQCGGPYKIGKLLRPELTKEAGRNWVLNCLNPNHEQNFKQSHVQMIVNMARSVGSTHYIHFFEKDNDMSQSVPLEPEDEVLKIQKAFIGSVDEQCDLVERFEKLVKANMGIKGVA